MWRESWVVHSLDGVPDQFKRERERGSPSSGWRIQSYLALYIWFSVNQLQTWLEENRVLSEWQDMYNVLILEIQGDIQLRNHPHIWIFRMNVLMYYLPKNFYFLTNGVAAHTKFVTCKDTKS